MIKKIELMYVSPEQAATWLAKNIGNRKLHRNSLYDVCDDLRQGRFKTTHQGILIGKHDRLIDGQHRLTAIVETGIGATLMVCWDDDLESALDLPIDTHLKRAGNFIKQRPKDCWEVARVLAHISTCNNNETHITKGPNNHDVDSFCRIIEWSNKQLTTNKRAGLSSAPIRAAFVLMMLRFPPRQPELLEQYRKLQIGEHQDMWTAIDAFERERIDALCNSQKRGTTPPIALFARAYRAVENGLMGKTVRRIQVNKHDAIIADAKLHIQKILQ